MISAVFVFSFFFANQAFADVCTTPGVVCDLNSTTKGVCGELCVEGTCGLSCISGTAASSTGSSGSPATGTSCILTTNEPGICMSQAECTKGFSSVAPCTSQGKVCCLAGTSSPTPATTGSTATSPSSSAASNRPATTTVGSTPSSGGLYIPSGSSLGLSDISVTRLIQNLMNWLLYILGFVAIIAFVISGIQYLLAGADEEMAKKGKENMKYAMIGVLVALSALIVIRAIQSVLSGAWFF